MASFPGDGSSNLTNSNENPQWTNQDSFGRVWGFVDLLPDEIAILGDLELNPGMSIEGYFHTGDRTVAVY